MVYDAWRVNGGPTLYDSNKTPVTADVLEAGLIYATVTLAFSLLIIVPGFNIKRVAPFIIKAVLGVFITGAIMLCNFGQEWEVAHINTKTQYRAGITDEIHADIGVAIGLRSVNITLKATPDEEVELNHGQVREQINYNERFSWDDPGWVQGRAGFGPFAGLVNREFREGQRKGLPYPILWIAEYFTIDGEGIRWGRHYRQAGFFTHILMWTAFPVWVLSMILMHVVLRYGGYMSIFTSVLLFTANILFATIRNPFDLAVPFEDDVLEFSWGWCFWLNIFNSFLCFIIGILIVIGDLFFYQKLCAFFGIDVLNDFEEIYADPQEIQKLVLPAGRRRARSHGRSSEPTSPRPRAPAPKPEADEDDDGRPPPLPQKRVYRKRTVGPRHRMKTSDIESGASGVNGWGNNGPAFNSQTSNGGDELYEMDQRPPLPRKDDNAHKFIYRSGSGDLDNAVNQHEIHLSET